MREREQSKQSSSSDGDKVVPKYSVSKSPDSAHIMFIPLFVLFLREIKKYSMVKNNTNIKTIIPFFG